MVQELFVRTMYLCYMKADEADILPEQNFNGNHLRPLIGHTWRKIDAPCRLVYYHSLLRRRGSMYIETTTIAVDGNSSTSSTQARVTPGEATKLQSDSAATSEGAGSAAADDSWPSLFRPKLWASIGSDAHWHEKQLEFTLNYEVGQGEMEAALDGGDGDGGGSDGSGGENQDGGSKEGDTEKKKQKQKTPDDFALTLPRRLPLALKPVEVLEPEDTPGRLSALQCWREMKQSGITEGENLDVSAIQSKGAMETGGDTATAVGAGAGAVSQHLRLTGADGGGGGEGEVSEVSRHLQMPEVGMCVSIRYITSASAELQEEQEQEHEQTVKYEVEGGGEGGVTVKQEGGGYANESSFAFPPGASASASARFDKKWTAKSDALLEAARKAQHKAARLDTLINEIQKEVVGHACNKKFIWVWGNK